MRKKTIAVVVVVLISAAVRAGESSSEWRVDLSLRAAADQKRQDSILICAFEQHDDQLSGTCRPESGPEGVPLSGTLTGNRVEWTFEIALAPTAPKQLATFRGRLNSSRKRMGGTVAVGDRRGTFTAARR